MEARNKWQHKVNSEKYKKGYADVSYEDTWCLDMTLARIIVNHLHAFLKAQKGPWGGCPGIFFEKYGSEKCHDAWLNTIRKMIYAFEEYQRNDKYDIDEEKRERIREGMQLFIDYYRNLWI